MRALYLLGIRSAWVRALFFGMPRSRFRTNFVSRYFWQIIEDMGQARFERFLPSVSPDAEVDLFGLGLYRGRDGWRDALQDFLETIPPESYELVEYLEPGRNDVLLIARWVGDGFSSGISVDEHMGFVLTIQKGMATWGQLIRTKSEALEAVGLSE